MILLAAFSRVDTDPASWLAAGKIPEGPLFGRLWGDCVGRALSPTAVAAILHRRAAEAGRTRDFGGHSLRSGFTTEGGRQGVPQPALMAMAEHRSVARAIVYFQATEAPNNPAARLPDDPPSV